MLPVPIRVFKLQLRLRTGHLLGLHIRESFFLLPGLPPRQWPMLEPVQFRLRVLLHAQLQLSLPVLRNELHPDHHHLHLMQ